MKRYVFLVLLIACICAEVGFLMSSVLNRGRVSPLSIPVTVQAVKQSPPIRALNAAPTSTAIVSTSTIQNTIKPVPIHATSTGRFASSSEAGTLLASSSSSLRNQKEEISLLLDVPFSTQAPLGVWDEVHEETCEETSVMLVAAFYDGERGIIPPKTADARILRIVGIEKELLGFYKDTDAADTAAFAKKAYPDLKAQVVPLKSAGDLKKLLEQGTPVIFPAAGKMLKNPNFKNGGPLYHMIVVIGYKDGYFITNDPGTRKGKSYLYAEDVLFAAAHDWNGGDVKNGEKVALVLQPK